MNNLTFGEALEYAKKGQLIQREGWNGKGMFVFIRPEDTIHAGTISIIKSLPQSVKNYFSRNIVGDIDIKFTSYLCMKAANNSIVNGWLASQTDMLSNDWLVLPE